MKQYGFRTVIARNPTQRICSRSEPIPTGNRAITVVVHDDRLPGIIGQSTLQCCLVLPKTRTRKRHHAQVTALRLVQPSSAQQVAIMHMQAVVVVGKTIAYEQYFFWKFRPSGAGYTRAQQQRKSTIKRTDCPKRAICLSPKSCGLKS